MSFVHIKRTDKNQQEIIKKLRKIGAYVIDIHNVGNCCDLVVTWRKIVFLVEIKSSKKAKLTPAEQKFINEIPVDVIIATTFNEVLQGMKNGIFKVCNSVNSFHYYDIMLEGERNSNKEKL